MHVLLTGASGFIGSHLTRALLRHGHQLTIATRNHSTLADRHSGIRAVPIDFRQAHRPEGWLASLEGVDVVINAVGVIREKGSQTFRALHEQAPVALFRACELTGIKRVIRISALGADDRATSRYHLSKKTADDFLASSELEWSILRPSIVNGLGARKEPAPGNRHSYHARPGKENAMEYLILKWIHILSAILLVGTGFGSAFYKYFTDRTGDIAVIAFTNRLVVLADWLFTTPSVIIQLITGLWMLHLLNLSLEATWLWLSLVLYLIAGACWLPVVVLQIRMRDLAQRCIAASRPLGSEYHRMARAWFWLGLPAFTAMVAVVWLMVAKSIYGS